VRVRERAWLVDGLRYDARGKPVRCLSLHVPAQAEPALGRVLEILQRRRLNGVDGDPLAWRENPDNTVAWHGSPIWYEPHRQIGIDAADRDRGTGFGHFDLHPLR